MLHRIKAYLYKNVFTKNPDDYTARLMSESSLNVLHHNITFESVAIK